MIIEIAKWTLVAFGIFFIGVGAMMLIRPEKARDILRKAGSTNFINYSEISLRIIPSSAFIIFSESAAYPHFFKLFGWFMLFTSFVLFFVPKELHHNFSNKCADYLKPVYFQLIAPFSILIGIMIVKSVI